MTKKQKTDKITLVGFAQSAITNEFVECIQLSGFMPKIVSTDHFLAGKTNPLDPHLISVALDLEHRKEVADYADENNYTLFTYIDPTAHISKTANISPGCFVGPFSFIGPNVSIQSHVIVAPYVMINHGSIVGRGTITHPSAIIAGSTKIGEFCRLSIRATVIDHLTLCDNVQLGAGSMLTKDVTEPGRYLGSPARKLITPPSCYVGNKHNTNE